MSWRLMRMRPDLALGLRQLQQRLRAGRTDRNYHHAAHGQLLHQAAGGYVIDTGRHDDLVEGRMFLPAEIAVGGFPA